MRSPTAGKRQMCHETELMVGSFTEKKGVGEQKEEGGKEEREPLHKKGVDGSGNGRSLSLKRTSLQTK